MLQERNPHRFEGVTSMTPQATLSAPKATHTPAGAALFLAYQNKEMAGLVGDLAINYGPEARDHPLWVPTGPSHLPFPNSPGPPSTTAAPIGGDVLEEQQRGVASDASAVPTASAASTAGEHSAMLSTGDAGAGEGGSASTVASGTGDTHATTFATANAATAATAATAAAAVAAGTSGQCVSVGLSVENSFAQTFPAGTTPASGVITGMYMDTSTGPTDPTGTGSNSGINTDTAQSGRKSGRTSGRNRVRRSKSRRGGKLRSVSEAEASRGRLNMNLCPSQNDISLLKITKRPRPLSRGSDVGRPEEKRPVSFGLVPFSTPSPAALNPVEAAAAAREAAVRKAETSRKLIEAMGKGKRRLKPAASIPLLSREPNERGGVGRGGMGVGIRSSMHSGGGGGTSSFSNSSRYGAARPRTTGGRGPQSSPSSMPRWQRQDMEEEARRYRGGRGAGGHGGVPRSPIAALSRQPGYARSLASLGDEFAQRRPRHQDEFEFEQGPAPEPSYSIDDIPTAAAADGAVGDDVLPQDNPFYRCQADGKTVAFDADNEYLSASENGENGDNGEAHEAKGGDERERGGGKGVIRKRI